MNNYTYASVEKSITNTIQVSDKWHEILEQMDKDEAKDERRETRRHVQNVFTLFGEDAEPREMAIVEPDFFELDKAEQEVISTENQVQYDLAKLKPKYHEVYRLWYLKKFTTVQIAKTLGIPQQTASWQVNKIRTFLGY